MRTKTTHRLLLLMLLLILGSFSILGAIPFRAYAPPTQVSVKMYRLLADGTKTTTLCTPGDINWGCTAFCNNIAGVCNTSVPTKGYPYSSSQVTVSIEQDYLLDVAAQETLIELSSFSSLEAQAMAVRSFTFGHIQLNTTLDNSSGKHVFVPYRFESRNPTITPNNSTTPCASTNLNSVQQKLCQAMANRYYVSYGTGTTEDNPAITQYFADIPNQTLPGTKPYELSVADPISSHPDIVKDGHGQGLSQKGASRWGYGRLGYKGDLAAWSVQWNSSQQILTHYLSGVHIRDSQGNRLTPAYRWNPLSINWGNGTSKAPNMMPNTPYNVTVQAQNSGVLTFASDVRLSCRWYKPNRTWVNCSSEVSLSGLGLGANRNVTLAVKPNADFSPGTYLLQLDVRDNGGFFATKESSRPWFTLDYTVCMGTKGCRNYLPMILKQSPVPTPTPTPIGIPTVTPIPTVNCKITNDNIVSNGTFGGNLSSWEVFIDKSSTGGFTQANLIDANHKDPGDTYPSAYLGGQDDRVQPVQGDVVDQYILQNLSLPRDTSCLEIEFSYCLTTLEPPNAGAVDKFFFDVLEAAGQRSLMPGRNRLVYTNQHPYRERCDVAQQFVGWRRLGQGTEPKLIIPIPTVAGVTIIFGSDVDQNDISTFYIDAIKVKAGKLQ